MNESKQALFFVNVWPEPRSTAAGLRTIEIGQFLQRLGYELVGIAPTATSQHSEAWEKTGVRILACDPNSSEAAEILKDLSPGLIIYDRFYTEEKYGWRARELWLESLQMIDTIDLHGLRDARQKAHLAGLNVSEPPEEFFSEVFLREMASLHRSDVCLVVSQHEAEWLTKKGFESERVCYLPFSAKAEAQLRAQNERRGFCFLGNYMHAPNVDAVRWLESELWPALRKQRPEAELHLYGAYPPQSISQLHGKNGIFCHGYVENHRQAIARHQVLLAPLRFGAGIKGKVLESWATGTPVLGTPIAFEGMGRGFAEFTDAAGFVDQIQALENPIYWAENAQQGLTLLQKKFESEQIFETFSEFLAASRVRLPQIRQSLTGRLLRFNGVQYLKYFSKWIEARNVNRRNVETDQN